MMTLMKGALSPSLGHLDKTMFLTSVMYSHSIHPDDNSRNTVALETVFDLLSSESTRYNGLQLLEIALQQNSSQFYHQGRWSSMIFAIIKDAHSADLEKTLACKVLAMVIPNLSSDDALFEAKEELIKEIFPVLLEKIKENVEWAEEACNCIKMCLKTFASELAIYEHSLVDVILHQASWSLSSKFVEVLAECFCEIPYCTKDNDVSNIQSRWISLYKRTLKTIEGLQVSCLKHKVACEQYEKSGNQADEFVFNKIANNVFYQDFCQDVRRFVNLCKCLAKLLSVKSKYSVKVPIRNTIHCLLPIYMGNKKEKLASSSEEIVFSYLPQMQLAGLVVFESLIKNVNIQKNAVIIRDLILVTIDNCRNPISSELLSDLRIATWKLLGVWLNGYGRNISKRIVDRAEIIEELLKDIRIDTRESQQIQTSSKSKKISSQDILSQRRSILIKKNRQKVCVAALETLESLLNMGALDMPKGLFRDICTTVFSTCHLLHSTCNPFPHPFDDETCRELLYTVVQAIALVTKPDEVQTLHAAMKIISNIKQDPSFKIRKFCNKASVINRLLLHPKRPTPVSSDNLRQPNVSNEVLRYSAWASDEFLQNSREENVSEIQESVNIDSSFQVKNEIEIHSEEYMEMEPHYPEQVVESQCNGEDLLEIQSSSHCQDEDESDEEEDEEDEDRSYIEEEMNQDEVEHDMYIPSNRKPSAATPIQISSETVQSISEPEYEELTPCIKVEENAYNNNTEDKCVNGEEEVVHDKDLPTSSVQETVTTENGIFGIEDDEDESDEEENEDEDEEEENESYPPEKREISSAERSESVGPPQKKQRIETIDDSDVNEVQERPQSPTMDEMKASLMEILPSEEEVRSGKVQLSATCQL